MDSIINSIYSYFNPPPPEPVYPNGLPSLPPELLLLIINHALPRPSYKHAHARQQTLLALSRTSRQFRALAQPLLFRHPVLPDLEAAELFLSALQLRLVNKAADVGVQESREGGRSGSEVKVLRLGWKEGSPSWGDCYVVGHLLRACPEVEELWLLGLSTVHLEDIWAGQSLRSLHLQETRITVGERLIVHYHIDQGQLPLLTHLSAKGTIFSGLSLQAFLSPSSLPSLTSLDYLSIHQSLVTGTAQRFAAQLAGFTVTSGDEVPFASIAGQLHHLRVGDYRTRSIVADDLALCTRLRTLDVPIAAFHPSAAEPDPDGLEAAVPAGILPPSLTLLRLRGLPIEDAGLVGPTYHTALARTGLLDATAHCHEEGTLVVILPRAVGEAAAAGAEYIDAGEGTVMARKDVKVVGGQERWLAGLEYEDAGFWLGWDRVRRAVEKRYSLVR